jgi:hypothetical protein
MQLQNARKELLSAELIAYRKPLYQVLDLSPIAAVGRAQLHNGDEAVSVGQVLQNILTGGVQ